jgi:cytidine deaminase
MKNAFTTKWQVSCFWQKGRGHNIQGPFSMSPRRHAEMVAIRCMPKQGRLLVVRHRFAMGIHEFSTAKPCAHCANTLREIGSKHQRLMKVSWTIETSNSAFVLSDAVLLHKISKGIVSSGFLKKRASFVTKIPQNTLN